LLLARMSRTGCREPPVTVRPAVSALMADRPVGTKSGSTDLAHVERLKGGANVPPFCMSTPYASARILPSTLRHHHNVVAASDAEIIAMTVNGSAALIVKSEPDTAAASARAAVLDVA
jgi:hypothetical protein